MARQENLTTIYSDELKTPIKTKAEPTPVRHEKVAPSFHEVDVLSQLKANINHLEDLQFRLSYMMGEIRSVIKK